MNAKDVMLHSFGMSDHVLNAYLGDLSDADLMVRPVEGQNHIAWQLGHLISSERMIRRRNQARLLPAPCPTASTKRTTRRRASRTTRRSSCPSRSTSTFSGAAGGDQGGARELSEADLDAPGPERCASSPRPWARRST